MTTSSSLFFVPAFSSVGVKVIIHLLSIRVLGTVTIKSRFTMPKRSGTVFVRATTVTSDSATVTISSPVFSSLVLTCSSVLPSASFTTDFSGISVFAFVVTFPGWLTAGRYPVFSSLLVSRQEHTIISRRAKCIYLYFFAIALWLEEINQGNTCFAGNEIYLLLITLRSATCLT